MMALVLQKKTRQGKEAGCAAGERNRELGYLQRVVWEAPLMRIPEQRTTGSGGARCVAT